MKANELMIGDWVSYKGNPTKIRTIEIYNVDVGPLQVTITYGDRICGLTVIDVSILKPIPLTPEILEKNGFVKSERYEVWKIIHDDYEMRVTPWRFAVIFLEDGADKEEFSTPRPNFVHELQHALRLCGIDKEIEL